MQELNNGQGRENEHKDMSIDLAELDATIARLRERMEASKSVPANIDAVSVATKGKMIVAAIFMVISMCVLALSSYAWFTASTASNHNIIQAGIAGVEFVDLSYTEGESGSAGTELDPIRILPGYAEERELYAKNVGDVAVYVRAKVVATIVLEERYASRSGEIDTSLVIFDINESKWTKDGDYYYLMTPLRGGKTSDELFDEIKFSEEMGNIYKGSTIYVNIVFEVVQASNNGTNALEAVGWKTDAEGGADQ